MADIYKNRKLLIETMQVSGLLKDNNLGSGYTDYHDKDNNCCVKFDLSAGTEINVQIKGE